MIGEEEPVARTVVVHHGGGGMVREKRGDQEKPEKGLERGSSGPGVWGLVMVFYSGVG